MFKRIKLLYENYEAIRKKGFLKISQNSQESTCAGDFFLNKGIGFQTVTLSRKETPV